MTRLSADDQKVIQQEMKAGLITGVQATSAICTTGTMICPAIPGAQEFTIPFAIGGALSDATLYYLGEKTESSIFRGFLIDIMKPKGIVGEIAGEVAKNIGDSIEKK